MVILTEANYGRLEKPIVQSLTNLIRVLQGIGQESISKAAATLVVRLVHLNIVTSVKAIFSMFLPKIRPSQPSNIAILLKRLATA